MPESHSEVTIHDGTDGGLVMDIHHQRHRGWSLCLIVHFQYDDFFFLCLSVCLYPFSLFPVSLSAPRCLSLSLPRPPSLSFFLSVSCFPPSLSPFLTAFSSITLSLSLSLFLSFPFSYTAVKSRSVNIRNNDWIYSSKNFSTSWKLSRSNFIPVIICYCIICLLLDKGVCCLKRGFAILSFAIVWLVCSLLEKGVCCLKKGFALKMCTCFVLSN